MDQRLRQDLSRSLEKRRLGDRGVDLSQGGAKVEQDHRARTKPPGHPLGGKLEEIDESTVTLNP